MTLQQKLLAKQSKKGFTLVELVVVIAILGILAAIAIPSVIAIINSANESAAQTDAATVDAACKDFYSVCTSGKWPDAGNPTKTDITNKVNEATIKEALEYANIDTQVALTDMSVDKSGTIFDTQNPGGRVALDDKEVRSQALKHFAAAGSLKALYTGVAPDGGFKDPTPDGD